MKPFNALPRLVLAAVFLASTVSVSSVQAATTFVQGNQFLQGHTSSGGANFTKDFMGYYASSDSVKLFNDETIRNIFKNDTGAGLGRVSSQVVVDPSNVNIAYFTTNQTGLKDASGSALARFRVNSYNFSTKKMVILYTKDYQDNGDVSGYNLLGSDGTWLVMSARSDNSPGPCANMYTSMAYGKLDMRNPRAGVAQYSFPQVMVDAEEARAQKCVALENPLYVNLDAIKTFAYTQSSGQHAFNFSADDLVARSAECGTNLSKAHFEPVVSSFQASSAQVSPITFVYNDPTHVAQNGTETYTVWVVPNAPKYKTTTAFKADFNLCAAGGPTDMYPFASSENYLLFTSSCGSGYSDGSGNPNGCQLIKSALEPTLKLKI